MKVLFICNQNENRSKTAEIIFKTRYNTKSAGLFCENPLKKEDILWAELVIVMEDRQRKIISERFPQEYILKRIINLNIPDNYYYMQTSLIEILKIKMNLAISELLI